MTPEDIEALKRLKELKDDGVITEDEFEVQKRIILSSDSVGAVAQTTLKPESRSPQVGNSGERTSPEEGNVVSSGDSTSDVQVLKGARGLLKVLGASILVVALVVVGILVSRSSDEAQLSESEAWSPTRTFLTPTTVESPITEVPDESDAVEVDLVDEGQVWVWYSTMVRCANESVVASAGPSMTRTDLVEVHQPRQSYYAGVSSRVADLVESTDWSKANTSDPSGLMTVMNDMTVLLRENQLFASAASRTAPEQWNDLASWSRELDFGARFQAMDDLIYSLIGGGFPPEIAESVGEDGSWCDYLSRYEESPPDYSYFRPEKNFTDEFWDYDLRQVCGMIRDLDVPNGNNSEANISYLSAQAQRLYEKILNDELYSQPQSRFYYLGIDLVATMEVFVEGTEQYMPLSHMSVVEDCEGLGW